METKAGVVVIGAGIVGCSAADHLTRLGWRDVVVLDQGPLFETGGSTSHAPGLVFQTNASKTMTGLASYGVRRYSELDLDGEPCFYGVGSVEAAATPERWQDLKRKKGLATSWGVEAHLLSPEECADKSPLLDPDRVYGGLYVPSDGIAKGVRICEATAREARSRGARFYGETEVLDIEVENGRIKAVETSRGRIATETVLSCAGMWGPRIGRMAGASVPLLTPMQHQYAWTTPLPELDGASPESDHAMLRHQDSAMYFRQHGDSYGVGSYRHRPMPVPHDGIGRPGDRPEMPSIMEFTPEDFEGPWQEAQRMLPALADAEVERGINGLFSFT
ncbi:MAG: FAD-binding oxidoreductase, partial [Rubrobacter sp.]|nr:FAD-binding oxidoreductase [Rubrobacter sp.]